MKYIVDARLGAGGMAEVFRGRLLGTAGFSRTVAIKRMNVALSGDEAFATMFETEAHTAALLQHPNIVAVLDFDRDESGALFLAMEFVDGADLFKLSELVRAKVGRFPPGLAAHIAAEGLRGLGHAHELLQDGLALRIVHRDVSPQNILIGRTGTVKIADFGIAKVTASAPGRHTGGIKGKLGYMAPEQANAQPLDARADVYAVGVILYELLAGVRAFTGKSETEILMKVLRGDVAPLASRALELPADLVAVVDRLMAFERERRFPSAAVAGEALRACRCFPADGTGELARLMTTVLPATPIGLGSMHPVLESWAPPLASTPVLMPASALPSPPQGAPLQSASSMLAGQPVGLFDRPAGALPMPATLVVPARQAPIVAGPTSVASGTPPPHVTTPVGTGQTEKTDPALPEARPVPWRKILIGVAIVSALATSIVLFRTQAARDDMSRTATQPGRNAMVAPDLVVGSVGASPRVAPAPALPAPSNVPDADFAGVAEAPAVVPRPSDDGGEFGTLVVRVNPSAQVVIDGQAAGNTPVTRKLPTGIHHLKLSNSVLGKVERLTVTVVTGRRLVIDRTYAAPQKKPPAETDPVCDGKKNPECLFRTNH
jgi:serine/threonine protein kinase